MGGIDHELEGRLARKRKREEVFQTRQEKERQRIEQASQSGKGEDDDNDDDGDDDEDDGGDDDDDDYRPGSFGHERVRPKRLRLEFEVDDLRDSFSNISDRRSMTSRDRSDVLTNFVEKGGGDLNDLPCGQKTMVK